MGKQIIQMHGRHHLGVYFFKKENVYTFYCQDITNDTWLTFLKQNKDVRKDLVPPVKIIHITFIDEINEPVAFYFCEDELDRFDFIWKQMSTGMAKINCENYPGIFCFNQRLLRKWNTRPITKEDWLKYLEKNKDVDKNQEQPVDMLQLYFEIEPKKPITFYFGKNEIEKLDEILNFLKNE